MESYRETKNRILPYDPATPLLGTYQKESNQHMIETPVHPGLSWHYLYYSLAKL
jgi:hypothetical protein